MTYRVMDHAEKEKSDPMPILDPEDQGYGILRLLPPVLLRSSPRRGLLGQGMF